MRSVGATVIVSNSRVVGTISGADGGTALVVPPVGKALVATAADPAQAVCFRMKPDGSAEHC